MYFSNACVELFRGIVMYDFVERDRELLPSYRGDQGPIRSISVRVNGPVDRIRISTDRTFAVSRCVLGQQELLHATFAYVDFWDAYPLGNRKFEFVCAEVIRSGDALQTGERLLVPFELVHFGHDSDQL